MMYFTFEKREPKPAGGPDGAIGEEGRCMILITSELFFSHKGRLYLWDECDGELRRRSFDRINFTGAVLTDIYAVPCEVAE